MIDSRLLYCNLEELSRILQKNEVQLYVKDTDFLTDLIYRSAELWRTYFSHGIILSSGGVETSLFGLKELYRYPALKSFNEYPGSLNSFTSLTQKLGKKFLLEEGLISPTTDQGSLTIAYSLGSHEGLMRAARIIYAENFNDGVFIPIGSYGLIASAFKLIKPVSFNVFLVKSDLSRGEKICLEDLKLLVRKNPSTKTLFIDQKTTAGAVYNASEWIEIIDFCKVNNLFLIVDAAHIHMEFCEEDKFPIVSDLCQKLDYRNYIILFTGSKTYGLERARVGLVLFDNRNALLSLKAMENQFIRMFGTFNDLPIVATHCLMTYPLDKRKKYLQENLNKHRYNMNLMIGYIEGITSEKIDKDLADNVLNDLPENCRNGISGLRIIYKPVCGIHLKLDLSFFKEKYFFNLQMFNSEIICYVFNKIFGVVTLHSSQILDESGYGMRLGFSSRRDVHKGMQLMHQFFSMLTDVPQYNPYMQQVISLEFLRSRFKSTKDLETLKEYSSSVLMSKL